MRVIITESDSGAATVLAPDILAQMGLRVGDKVDVNLIDGSLVVRPISEAERAQKVAAAVDDVFERRRDALKRLAQ